MTGIIRILFLAIFLLIPTPSNADEALSPSEWGIPAQIISVYDGDTIKVIAHPWPDHTIETNVRLEGIDTPEIRGDCDEEIRLAEAARDRLRELAGEQIYLRNIKNGRYPRRIIARTYTADGEDITAILLEEHYGRPWIGYRASWCD